MIDICVKCTEMERRVRKKRRGTFGVKKHDAKTSDSEVLGGNQEEGLHSNADVMMGFISFFDV